MTWFAKATLPLSMLLAVCPAQAASTEGRFAHSKQADAHLSALAKRYEAGIAVGVIRGSRLIWTGYYGGQGDGAPVSKDSLFNVASLTKPLAAETILRLVSEARISLDEPMSSHWIDPDLVGDKRHL